MYQLRVAVFVVEQNCPYQEVDAADQTALHLMGYDATGRLATYARLIPEAHRHVRIGRVITAAFARGHGAGRELVSQALTTVRQEFPTTVQIDIQAQAYLQQFYASFGFQPVSDVYLEDNIPHLDMILPIN